MNTLSIGNEALVHFNPLPNDKILNQSKFKAIADIKIYVNERLNLFLDG